MNETASHVIPEHHNTLMTTKAPSILKDDDANLYYTVPNNNNSTLLQFLLYTISHLLFLEQKRRPWNTHRPGFIYRVQLQLARAVQDTTYTITGGQVRCAWHSMAWQRHLKKEADELGF